MRTADFYLLLFIHSHSHYSLLRPTICNKIKCRITGGCIKEIVGILEDAFWQGLYFGGLQLWRHCILVGRI